MTLRNATRPPNSHGPIPEKSYYKQGSLNCHRNGIQQTCLALQREECQAKEYACCNEQCLKDDYIVVESRDYAKSEGFHKSKKPKETKVQRVAVALPVQQAQDNKGSEEGHIKGPYASTT
jgi:hypothetical protein